MRSTGPSRFSALAALLLLMAAGLGALAVFNYQGAQRATEHLAAAGQIARQQSRPQLILANIQLLRSDLAARRFLGRSLRDLDTNVGALDAAVLELDPAAFDTQRLTALQQHWSEFRRHLQPIVGFQSDPYVETAEQGTQLSPTGLGLNLALEQAARFGLAHHDQISTLIGGLADAAHIQAETRTLQLRQWLLAGLGAAALLLAIVLLWLHGLSRNQRRLSRAKQETDDILRTVNQGLFLLDDKLKLGSERSEALGGIFRRNDFENLDFAGLLRGLVPEKTLETAAEFVKLLWGERVNERLIKSINPLSEVEAHFETADGKTETQYLEFDFNRVRSNGQFSRILVMVNDVTRRVQLARELQDSQEKAQSQLDLLLHIMHVEPRQLAAFLEESQVSLKTINAILKEPAREETAFRNKLDSLFRGVHSLKGEASALGLDTVQQRAHSFEEALAALRNKDKLGGGDFLPLVVKLDDLFKHFAQVREMIGRLADLRVAMSAVPAGAGPATPARIATQSAPDPAEAQDITQDVVAPESGEGEEEGEIAAVESDPDAADETNYAQTSQEQTAPEHQPQEPAQAFEDPQAEAATPESTQVLAQDSTPQTIEDAQAVSGGGDTLIQRPPPEALELLRQSAAGGDIESALTQLAQRIARKQSKQVEVNCSGLERVPAKFRRAIKDIAIQMVRNSLAHGIEMPQERSRLKKTAVGAIVVRFENHGAGGYEFVFQDDGRGLRAKQLKERAVERGLISAQKAAALDERHALALIFMAGFSTQAQVTEDAGRGVGMDIVRTKVMELGGKVGISTSAGKFLRFRIWLPAGAEARAA